MQQRLDDDDPQSSNSNSNSRSSTTSTTTTTSNSSQSSRPTFARQERPLELLTASTAQRSTSFYCPVTVPELLQMMLLLVVLLQC
ncbi:hypothetical protein AWZ03_001441 [Drosophila navojoa]|uniref:Uncharacterized protein n=1 Tax=Drosophila navojoa TaxID=7232 RepID=A0A484BVP4_DRONA|nr:hypothetical protein AWZ03_001441 [Drosophila navojoa]